MKRFLLVLLLVSAAFLAGRYPDGVEIKVKGKR